MKRGVGSFAWNLSNFPPNNKCFHSLSRAVKLTTLSSYTNKRREVSELTASFYSVYLHPSHRLVSLLQYLLYLPLLAFCIIPYGTIFNFFCSELNFNHRVLFLRPASNSVFFYDRINYLQTNGGIICLLLFANFEGKISGEPLNTRKRFFINYRISYHLVLKVCLFINGDPSSKNLWRTNTVA